MTIRERIRYLLDERGWSQAQLAQASGLDPSVLSRLLGGDRAWRSEHLACIAAALSKTPEELVDGTDAGIPTDRREFDSEFIATLTTAHGALVGENRRLTAELDSIRRQVQLLEEDARRLTQQKEESRLALDREQRARATDEIARRAAEKRETQLTRNLSITKAESAARRSEVDAARRQLAVTEASHGDAVRLANHNYAVAKDLERRLASAQQTAVAVSVVGAAVMVGAALSANDPPARNRRRRRA